MKEASSLSIRGKEAANTVLRVDMKIYGEALGNIFHKIDNPDGILFLNMAENKLSWHLMQQKIETITRDHSIPGWVSNYTSSMGHPEFRVSLANFMSRFLTECPIDPNHLGTSAGATATIEVSSWILGGPGDVAVFPAPCYPVYKQDINNKSALERYDLITHKDLDDIKDDFVLNIQHLEQALQDIANQGKRFRMLVLTSPDNPTGGIYEFEKLNKIAKWCIEHQIHLVVNEIYGLSLIDTKHSEIITDYKKDIPFQSFAQIMQEYQSDYLHYWYSLSKDFGVSGFRVGIVYSLNQEFLAAFENMNAPHMVSNYTQWIFQEVLKDHAFIENYISKNQKALTESYTIAVKHLRSTNIPYVASRGSLFIWVDLSDYLYAPTKKAETALWLDIYSKTKVLITPADGFGNAKRGQYRIVYTAITPEDLDEAMGRLCSFLERVKG